MLYLINGIFQVKQILHPLLNNIQAFDIILKKYLIPLTINETLQVDTIYFKIN